MTKDENDILSDILSDELLTRFLQGECTEEELREVDAWLKQDNRHERELFGMEELYQLGKFESIREKNTDKAERLLFRRIEREKKTRGIVHRLQNYLRYAAILAGIVLIGSMGWMTYLFYEQNESLLAVNTGDKVKALVLPDGTKVWLNAHTQLKYPREFDGEHRKVYLEGEGYFEVKKDEGKPFIVQSEAMQVKVLGTVFNLSSEKSRQTAVAMLFKGEIEVKGNNEEGMVILSPGQKAELDKAARRLTVKQVEAGMEDWHNRSFIFEKADIHTIARILEASYGVKIVLAPGLDMFKTYSGTLKKKENVGAVLDLIRNAVPINYKIEGETVYLSPKR